VNVDDTAEVGLRFAGGPLASLHLDYAQQPPSHEFHINFSEGSLQCDLLAGTARCFRAPTDVWDEYRVPKGWERNAMFIEEMKHFLDVVRGETRPGCTLEDGNQVMRIIAAVQESNRAGRLVSLRP
jgi:predicted dehydrogenase